MKTWFILALLTALFASLKDVFSKAALKNSGTCLIAWFWSIGTLPFLLPFLPFMEIPRLNRTFWLALAVGGILHVAATILYIKALRSSDLSLTVPMITFTPLFLLLTSPVMTGEVPAPLTIVGIILIVVGAYLINIHDLKKGFAAPFKALIREPGPRMMLGVAAIWSITANIDKIGITCTSPVFWLIAIESVVAAAMFPFVRFTTPAAEKIVPSGRSRCLTSSPSREAASCSAFYSATCCSGKSESGSAAWPPPACAREWLSLPSFPELANKNPVNPI